MRTRNFEVPADLIVEFAEIIESEELDNTIDGVTGDGDIEVSVEYEPHQRSIINRIHDMIDKYKDEIEEPEEDEDEEDDD